MNWFSTDSMFINSTYIPLCFFLFFKYLYLLILLPSKFFIFLEEYSRGDQLSERVPRSILESREQLDKSESCKKKSKVPISNSFEFEESTDKRITILSLNPTETKKLLVYEK